MHPSVEQVQLLMNLMRMMPLSASFVHSNPVWPSWNVPWQLPPNPLQSALENANPILEALNHLLLEQAQEYIAGVQACMGEGFTHQPTPSKTIWARSTCRLLDYAPHAKHKTAVLCIPSLINKSYILDLLPDASLISYLKTQGMRPLLLDWGEPTHAEEGFCSADYIQAYALEALAHLREQHDGPIIVLGYCMGGIFALSMAQLAPLSVDALVLIATPWDFASHDTPVVLVNPASQATMRHMFQAQPIVPPWMMQAIFFWLNPSAHLEKMQKFSGLSPQQKKRFAAIETWANDGMGMSSALAQECFIDWPQQNMLSTHSFHIGRTWIDPERITCEALVIAAKHDKIVPIGCAKPLAKHLPRATIITPDSGHVGMVAGTRAPELMWDPLVDWIEERF